MKLISIEDNEISFETPKDLIIKSLYLLNELNDKIELQFNLNLSEITVENPLPQLQIDSCYALYLNDEEIGSAEQLLIAAEGIIIEQKLTSTYFRKKIDDISFIESNQLLEDNISVENVSMQDAKLVLEIPNKTVCSGNVFGFFAVNRETKEIKSLKFYHIDGLYYVCLLEDFNQGLWQINILHRFDQYFLLDNIVQGNANQMNESYFIGYVGEYTGKHIGAYFDVNQLIITYLLKEDFFNVIPVNEKTDILLDTIEFKDGIDKYVELNTSDSEVISNANLVGVFLNARKSKERVCIPFVSITNNTIRIPLSSQLLEAIEYNRWNLEAHIISENHSISGRLRINREVKEKVFYLDRYSDNDGVLVYTTKNNYLSVLKSSASFVFKERHKLKATLTKLTNSSKGYRLTINVNRPKNIEINNIVLKLRSNDVSKMIVLENTRIKILETNKQSVSGSFVMDWDNDFYPLYWDVYLQVTNSSGIQQLITVKGARRRLRWKVSFDYFSNSIYTSDKIVYPYMTVKGDVAFMMRDKETFETKTFKLKEKIAFIIYLLLYPFYYKNKDIWLGFEKFSSTAQDNGYAFFRYVDKNKLHENFYYILKEDSTDYIKASRESDKIVPFMSFKYLLLIYASNIFVTSEHKRHAYHLRVRTGLVGRKIENKKSVFLQHGVTALKKTNFFKKARARGNFKLVIATSNLEKEIIHKNWNYKPNEIAVTGFPRWDYLFDKSRDQKQKKIFVMPTWRTWLEGMKMEDFKQTDYFKNYQLFLNSKELEAILKAHNIELCFFLHPKFSEYFSAFEIKNQSVQIKEFQSVKVNEELMESSLLISDYSSVTWDMFFMKKPVIFYQFDFEQYNDFEGSYIDMENDLFGDRALNGSELVALINEYAMNNFQLKDEYHLLYNEYFEYMDRNNSSRTFEVIKKLK